MTVAHIASPAVAAQTIRHEHNRLAEMVMATIDVLGDVQAGTHTGIRMDRLRAATAKSLREALTAREAALDVLTEVSD